MLASAYARVFSHDNELVDDMGGSSVLGRSAPRLASAFKASPAPFVMMLDDLHVLRSEDCHDMLSVVIAGPASAETIARNAMCAESVIRSAASSPARRDFFEKSCAERAPRSSREWRPRWLASSDAF